MAEILIKKYENRRLYCVPEAKYVSLSEIKAFLQDGKKVKVIEKKTGKDITKYVLVQVLLEERYELLPTQFYQMILQVPTERIDKFFNQFFPWMMEYYKALQDGNFPQFPQQTMGFMPQQNPWLQANPFMNNNINPFASSNQTSNSSGKSSEKMDEILKRLHELEGKLKDQD